MNLHWTQIEKSYNFFTAFANLRDLVIMLDVQIYNRVFEAT